MANSYRVWIDRAKVEFKRRVVVCTTLGDASKLIEVVSESLARSAASTTEDCLALLNANPDLMTRRLPDSEMDDCETINDVVWAFMDHAIASELHALIPSSLTEE